MSKNKTLQHGRARTENYELFRMRMALGKVFNFDYVIFW